MSRAGALLAKQIDFRLKSPYVQADVGQVIAREVYYQLTIRERVLDTPKNQQKINFALMTYVAEQFKQYIDTRARNDHARFHHVYEWDRTGNAASRLFNVRVVASGMGAVAKPVLLKSKTRNRNGHLFANKASVMESGQPVVIKPKNVTFLKFELNGETIFTRGPIYVQNPGGIKTNASLEKAFKAFNNSGMPGKIMKDSRLISRILGEAAAGKTPKAAAMAVAAAANARADIAVERNTII